MLTMTFSSKKGYSLIEIGIGVLILTIFLLISMAMFNGCYRTYRMIQQRNLAIDYAVSQIETVLQTDADILTGFFVEELDATTNTYELKPSEAFRQFVEDGEDRYESRYATIMKSGTLADAPEDEWEAYVKQDKDFLIEDYIRQELEAMNETDFLSEEVQNGNYGFLTDPVTVKGALDDPNIGNRMEVKTTISRLPISEEKEAFGNRVLRIKVEVFYTNLIDNQNLSEDNKKSIVLETVKVDHPQ